MKRQAVRAGQKLDCLRAPGDLMQRLGSEPNEKGSLRRTFGTGNQTQVADPQHSQLEPISE